MDLVTPKDAFFDAGTRTRAKPFQRIRLKIKPIDIRLRPDAREPTHKNKLSRLQRDGAPENKRLHLGAASAQFGKHNQARVKTATTKYNKRLCAPRQRRWKTIASSRVVENSNLERQTPDHRSGGGASSPSACSLIETKQVSTARINWGASAPALAPLWSASARVGPRRTLYMRSEPTKCRESVTCL